MKEIKRKLALVLTVCMVLNTVIPTYADELKPPEALAVQQEMLTEDSQIIQEIENAEVMESQQDALDTELSYEEEVTPENVEKATPANAECTDEKFIRETVADGIKITLISDVGVFPEDAEIWAEKVEDEYTEEAIEEAVEKERDNNVNVASSYKFDIKVFHNGEEVQPDTSKGSVKVTFTLVEELNECIEVNAYHLKEAADGELTAENLGVEVKTVEEALEETVKETGETSKQLNTVGTDEDGAIEDGIIEDDVTEKVTKIEAETDGFSYYVVEFTYNELRYVLPGNSSIKLSEILKTLAIEGTVSETEVSNGELFTVTKDEEGDDWTVTSHKAFNTEEWMKITLSGHVYVITVTDTLPVTVKIDAPDGYKKNLVTLDAAFTTKHGKRLHALIGSTTEQNREAILKALSQYYDSTLDIPIKLIHKDFVDAEKWNADPEEHTLDEGLQDSLLCWAASLSGILWSSGWAQNVKKPETKEPMFISEDEVFTWLSWYPPSDPHFFNRGGEADKGIDWFFDGSYLASGFRSSPWNVTNDNKGWFPELMAECLYEKVSIVDAPQKLEIIERLSADSKMPAFTASVGTLDNGAAAVSEHSMTAMGLIIDSAESKPSTRYKAIILADPDNDGTPSIDIKSSDEERIADRSNRPNSYTVYPLRLITDSQGKKCWQIIGLTDETCILYELIYLSAMTEDAMGKAKETEGTRDVYRNSDFLFGEGVTSNAPPISPTSKDESVSEFQSGEDIYLIFELFEKGVYSEEKSADIKIRLELTRNSVPFIETIKTLNVVFPFAPIDVKEYLKLNEAYDLPQGRYTLTAEINPKLNKEQRYPESYYRNNRLLKLEFSVIGKQDPIPPRRSSENGVEKPVFTGTWNNPVSNGKWTLDVNGVWHYKTNAMFRSTWGYIVNPYADARQNTADWFWFDEKGNMLIGWQFINGKWYYLNPIKNSGTYGACFLGPGRTPDGYEIDAAGAWTGK